MVVAFHAGVPMPGGFVGVDVFFVISGFVITLTAGRASASGPAGSGSASSTAPVPAAHCPHWR